GGCCAGRASRRPSGPRPSCRRPDALRGRIRGATGSPDMRGAALALTAGLMASAAVAAVPGLGPGVSRELAQWRAKHYRDVRYALAISVTAGATKLAGTTTVEVTLSPTVPDLVLDWRTSPGAAPVVQLRVNGKRVKAKLEREH